MRKTTVRKYTTKQAHALMNGKTTSISRKKVTKNIEHTRSYKIEKDIPIPRRAALCKYPLYDMEIGDSFVIPLSEKAPLRNALYRAHKSGRGFRFITRTVNGRGRAGKQVRVWRISK